MLWEWIGMALRWLHVIAGIAWIGASFYFVHLDASLRPRDGLPAGVSGESWQVHGGGFYHMLKFTNAPDALPKELIWFKWEAYTTWISGFFLLVVVYYLGAEIYLIDPRVLDMPVWLAVLVSLATLAGGWVAYDQLCKSRLGTNDAALAAAGFVFLVAVTWVLTLVYSGRGAYVHAGALIGTIMVANVAMIIIPNQKKVVTDLIAGREPDPALGIQAKQRSLHNNYLTLPVLFVMISGHYPLSFASRWNWLIFAVILVVGAVIRHFYNVRHQGRPSPWWTWAVAAAGMAAIVWLSLAGPAEGEAAALEQPADFAAAEEVVLIRCSMCHTAEPLWEGIAVPPKGVVLDTPEAIVLQADAIRMQAVLTDAMPPSNITEMTAEERAVLGTWIAAGARIE